MAHKDNTAEAFLKERGFNYTDFISSSYYNAFVETMEEYRSIGERAKEKEIERLMKLCSEREQKTLQYQNDAANKSIEIRDLGEEIAKLKERIESLEYGENL